MLRDLFLVGYFFGDPTGNAQKVFVVGELAAQHGIF